MIRLLLRISVAVVALALISEIGLRAFIVLPASIEANESLGWLYSPNSTIRHSSEGYAVHTTNSLGLIDDELRAGSDSLPIVVVGDSFVESLQLSASKNFTSLTEQFGECDDLLNAGRSGISPLLFPAMLAHIGTAVTPKALVMVVSPGDRRDIESSDLLIDLDDNKLIQKIEYLPPKPNRLRLKLDPILRRSALATYLMNRLKAALAANPQLEIKDVTEEISSVRTTADSKIEDILAFQFEKSSRKRPSIVLYLPELEYLDEGSAIPTSRSTAFALLTKSAAARSSSTFVDTSGALASLYKISGQPGHGFANNSPTSGHLNESGHRVVAQELQNALASLGLCN